MNKNKPPETGGEIPFDPYTPTFDLELLMNMPQARIAAGVENGEATAVLEFRLRLDDLPEFKIFRFPKLIRDSFALMQAGLSRVDLDLKFTNQIVELYDAKKGSNQDIELKLVDVVLDKFRLQKVEQKGKGNTEVHQLLIFCVYCELTGGLARYLITALGSELGLVIQAAQPPLPLKELSALVPDGG